jgi:hypothetical protein
MSIPKMQIHLPPSGLASFGRGVARRIRVKPRNLDVDERDLRKTRKISIRTFSHPFPTMQDPDHAVGEEHVSSFAGTTSPTSAPATYDGASAPLTAATAPPTASGIDEATKKAVDNVLYSDVRIEISMRWPLVLTIN